VIYIAVCPGNVSVPADKTLAKKMALMCPTVTG